jgi:ABC-type multidrug transport system fused ATPase/permease subunit
MGLEIEAAGDLLTASLVASEIEGHKGQGGEHAHGAPCANCGTPVHDNFCGHCGQKGHLHKSVLHLGEELIHGLLHFDTKGWRTLPLLVARPGQLTRRYIDGQRTRFVSPLALFLFMMFFMFFIFSLTMGTSSEPTTVTEGKDGKAKFEQKMNSRIEAQKEVIAEAEKDLKEADADEVPNAKRHLEDAKKKLEGLNTALAAGKLALSGTGKVAGTGEKSEKDPDVLKEIANDISITPSISITPNEGKVGDKNAKYSNIHWINKGIKHAADNPELAKYKLKNAAYKYSFLLVPISMPFLWLIFFWRRGITMYDHAVFSLYSLSFMSLLFTIVATLGYFNFGGWAASLFAFVPPVHMFLQLRGTYGLSGFGAFWRTCFMLVVAFIVLSMYALVVLALTAA